MSGYGSIWVKLNDPATDLALLQEEHNKDAILPEGLAFACAVKDAADGETPERRMRELSQRFGEAIFMTVQTTVDFFIYSHWRDGGLAREIQYCADEGWYLLDGDKEAWERRLFGEEERQRQLGYLDLERLANDPGAAEEYAQAQRAAAQLEAVWSAQELLQGGFYPMASASELYHIVMQEFGLANPHHPK